LPPTDDLTRFFERTAYRSGKKLEGIYSRLQQTTPLGCQVFQVACDPLLVSSNVFNSWTQHRPPPGQAKCGQRISVFPANFQFSVVDMPTFFFQFIRFFCISFVPLTPPPLRPFLSLHTSLLNTSPCCLDKSIGVLVVPKTLRLPTCGLPL